MGPDNGLFFLHNYMDFIEKLPPFDTKTEKSITPEEKLPPFDTKTEKSITPE